MITEINQTVEQTNAFLYSSPQKSKLSTIPLHVYDKEIKQNELRSNRLVPVQRTCNECIIYALGEWRCACLTIILISGIISLSSCGVKQLVNFMNSSHSDAHFAISYHKSEQNFRLLCQTSSLLIIGGLLFLVYLVYLIESWQSRNWIQTTWLIDTKMAYNLVHNAHKLIPSILWKVKCYHYAHNTPQFNHYQQNQHITLNEIHSNNPKKYPFNQDDFEILSSELNKQTNQYSMNNKKIPKTYSQSSYNTNINQIKCHRIITMNKMRSFDLSKIDSLWDMSDSVSELENFQLIELNLSSLFSFSDKQTYLEFQRQKQEFFTTYEKFDVYMETEQICTFAELMKFPKRFLITHELSKTPVYLKGITYLIATLFLCSYPLRIFIYANKAKLHCKIHKIFGPKPTNESLQNPLKLIPLNDVRTNSNVIWTHTISTSSKNTVPSIHKKLNHILNLTTQNHFSNNTNSYNNNEAVVVFNKHITENATDFTGTHEKRRNKYLSTTSKRTEYRQGLDPNFCNHINRQNNVDSDQYTNEDDDDDELLSLDIRFDEYIKNKCVNDDDDQENDYYDYELDTVLRNSNADIKCV
ncbi:Transmembrane protein [Schistosoma japonicum]|uniref:Transmembrane protein n=1 Tax=Schistosoma japonicum TaxID=6182 RepID=A0A4Z2CZG1_SCHJA|nr:Transmembrane protein [Schistosoma japonicum]